MSDVIPLLVAIEMIIKIDDKHDDGVAIDVEYKHGNRELASTPSCFYFKQLDPQHVHESQ
jgi:hypothetical protein